MFKLIILVLIAVLAVHSAAAQTPKSQNPPSAETLEAIDKMDQAMRKLDTIATDLKWKVEQDKLLCLKAFGYPPFCECISSSLPMGIAFQGYAYVLTSSKEELKYDTLKKADKQVVDATYATRDKCVNQIFGQRSVRHAHEQNDK